MNLKRLQKPALVLLATAPIGILFFSFVFMARYEAAFDEETCPYVEVETRELSEGASMREDRRACQEGIEERRWVLMREGEAELELGRRPLDAESYAGDYSWTAAIDDEDRATVDIRNPGHEMRRFREPSPDSGLR